MPGEQMSTSSKIVFDVTHDWGTGSVRLVNPKFEQLQQPDEVVISKSPVKLEFDYPLENPVEYLVPAPDGAPNFTRAALVTVIIEVYRWLYDVEDQSIAAAKAAATNAGEAVVEAEQHPQYLLNARTDPSQRGILGIYGHDMSDLFLESVVYDEERDVYEVRIGS